MRKLLLGLLLLGMVALLGAALWLLPRYHEYQRTADAYDLAEIEEIPAVSEVFDVDGNRYSRLEGEVRYVVPFAKISPRFIDAVLAREDARFHEHDGVDLRGIFRAAMRNFREGEVREGASTITQQLARNTFAMPANRWERKIVEALLARRIERRYSKQQILEAYANRIYFGIGLYGVETAARACFGKSAADLTLSEAAILAGLIRSPNRFSPLRDSESALAERDQVIARMQALGMITSAEADAALAEPIPDAKRATPRVQENYAMDAVMREIETVLPKVTIDRGGLKIYTTIDRRLQLLAESSVATKLAELEREKDWPHPVKPEENAVREGSESPWIEGALVAIDNASGGIRAIVGGRDFKTSPYNRAILMRRQVGSTFKPFVYAAAFDRGLMPGTLVSDDPIREGELTQAGWDPENADGQSLGLQPAMVGLIRSRNTMTVRIGETVGLAGVREMAERAGLGEPHPGPSVYLGAFEVPLRDLTAAYTMFSNDGVRRQPYLIERIEDRNGRTIYLATKAQLRTISPGAAYVVRELLGAVMTQGTGVAAAKLGLKLPSAGKTGTTNDFRDAWFVGFTNRLTCGVWVGMDRPQRIVNKGYASRLALPVWVDFVKAASEFRYEPEAIPRPGDLRRVELCRVSGELAGPSCVGSTYAIGLPATMAPRTVCRTHGGALVQTPTLPPPSGSAPGAPDVPVARAVPVSPGTAEPAVSVARARPAVPAEQVRPVSGARYRVMRTPQGLRLVYERPATER